MTGSCLCGAVRWTTSAALRPVFECHCHRCRRTTGNFMAATAVATDELELIVTDAALRWFHPVDDPNVADGFCGTCGGSLFFRAGVADGSDTLTSICAGTVDDPTGLETTEIWFADHAAPHVRLAAGPGVVVHADNP